MSVADGADLGASGFFGAGAMVGMGFCSKTAALTSR